MLQEISGSQKVGWELWSLEIVTMSIPRALFSTPTLVSRYTREMHLHQMSWGAGSHCRELLAIRNAMQIMDTFKFLSAVMSLRSIIKRWHNFNIICYFTH